MDLLLRTNGKQSQLTYVYFIIRVKYLAMIWLHIILVRAMTTNVRSPYLS